LQPCGARGSFEVFKAKSDQSISTLDNNRACSHLPSFDGQGSALKPLQRREIALARRRPGISGPD
jgi:hypothetical protein